MKEAAFEATDEDGDRGGGGELGSEGSGILSPAEEYTSSTTSPYSGDLPWPALMLRCVLQVSHELNTTSDLPLTLLNFTHYDPFQPFAADPFQPHVEEDLLARLNNDSDLWQQVNTSIWETEGGTLLARCLESNSPTDRPYLLPWWQQLTWTLAFGSMLLVAVGGNAIVMWIVIAHRRMRTVTNYFLVNLSAADLLMAVFNCIFNFIYMLHSDWPFGAIYCTISNFMANVTIAASVFTLMAISFDRYIAIVKPLKPRMSKSEARHFILVIWLCSMTLAIPCLLYSTTASIRYKNDEIRRGCFLKWPDGETSISYREYVYNIVFFSTTYVLPMLAMLVSYSLIGCELWGSHSIGEFNDRQISSIKSKRRVVRMFIVIVVVFMLCWLPQQGFFLYQYHNSQVLDSENIQHIYLGFYWLAMANALVNPIIYYWMNARFRSYFREVVVQCATGRCICCCLTSRPSYLDSPHMTRRRQHEYSPDHTSRSRSGLANNRYTAKMRNPKLGDNALLFSSPKMDADHCHTATHKNDRGWQQVQYMSRGRGAGLANQLHSPILSRSVNGLQNQCEADEINSDSMGECVGDHGLPECISSSDVNKRGNASPVTIDAEPPEVDDYLPTSLSHGVPFRSSQMLVPSLVGNAILCDRSHGSENHNDILLERNEIEMQVFTPENNKRSPSPNSTKTRRNLAESPTPIVNGKKANITTEGNGVAINNAGAFRNNSSIPNSTVKGETSLDDTLALTANALSAKLRSNTPANKVHQAIEETLTAVVTQACQSSDLNSDEVSNVYQMPQESTNNIQQEIML